MNFLNRIEEQDRIIKSLRKEKPQLVFIYGRRRCGKSTLIKQTLRDNGYYFMAYQTDAAVQRTMLANLIGETITGFNQVKYPDWYSLFLNLNNSIKGQITLCLDEFPYLVKSSPDLPSVIQKICDELTDRKFHLIICGSSQQMMQNLILSPASPIYGRANEIMKITPLAAGWLPEAISCTATQAVEEYSVWGGVPRYWEIRSEESDFETAVKASILDRFGILHEEPARLFFDDMRESIQAFSVLSVIGNGVNRISEIASRLNKPSTQLSGILDTLIKLGYIKREIPYGENPRNSKRSLYKIADPFMNFYFTFAIPHLSRLELGMVNQVYSQIETQLSKYISFEWENLCRMSVPYLKINNIDFDIASRWWGSNAMGKIMEIDVVAESLDKKTLLVGECKWSKIDNAQSILTELIQKAELLPFAKGKNIVPILFCKEVDNTNQNNQILVPEDIITILK